MHAQDELFTSTAILHFHRYKGLIRRSIIKNLRDEIFRFLDYMYIMGSSHEIIVNFMRNLYFIQIFLITLCPLSEVFWPHDSVLGKIINIIAVIGNLCTPQSSELAHITVSFVLYSIIFLMIVFLFFNVYIFHKYTKVSMRIINFFCVFLNAMIPYFILYIGSNMGREISIIVKYYLKSIKYVLESDNLITLEIICLSLGLFLEIILFAIHLIFVSPIIYFRPQSIHFLSSKSSFFYLGSFFLISILLTLAGSLNNYIILFFTLIPLLCLHVLTYRYTELWGTLEFREMSLSVLETISILLFIEYFLLIFKVKMNEILLLIIIIFYIFLYNFATTKGISTREKVLTFCDIVSKDPDKFERLNENNALLLLRIGFEMGHKICHNWSAFEYAEKQFPGNQRIFPLFIRYSTLYPEEKSVFKLVMEKVLQMKKNNIEYKFLLFQLNSLSQQRERGLSKSLKKILAHLDNKTDKCRNQIRQIWTMIIQGNLFSVENLSYELKKNVDEVTREYNQLCISYPNNPYVASSFSAFLSDIWCKERESMAFKRIYRLLRNGGKTRIEKTLFFAKQLFLNIPNEEQHRQLNKDEDEDNMEEHKGKHNNNNLINSIISMSIDNFNEVNEEMTKERGQQKYLETMVESIHLSSLRYGPFFLFISLSFVFPLLSIFFALYVTGNMKANMNGVHLIEKESLQKVTLSHISIAFYYYVLNSNRILSSLVDILSLQTTNLKHLVSLVKYDEDLMNDINDLFPDLYMTGYFDKSLNFLLDDSMSSIHIFTTNSSYGEKTNSYEFYIALVHESVLRATALKAIKLLNMPDFWSLIYTYPHFLNQTDDFAVIQMAEMSTMVYGNFRKTFNVVLSSGLFALAFIMSLTVFLFKKMDNEKEALFMCFKSLPKSAISATISKLNAQLGKHEDEQDNQIIMPLQEEKAFRLLTMNKSRVIANSYNGFVITILVTFVLCSLLTLFFLVRSQKVIIDTLPKLCSVMYSAASLHSTFAALILTQARIVAYNQKQIPINALQTKDELIKMTRELFEKLRKHQKNFKFGEKSFSENSRGLFGFDNGFISYFTNASMLSTKNCTLSNETDSILNCISLENSMAYVNFLLNGLFDCIKQDANWSVPLNHESFAISIRWLFNTSFPEIVLKMIGISVNSAESLHFTVEVCYIIVPLVLFNTAIFLCGIFLLPRLVKAADVAKWTLRLLLFCRPSVVLHSHRITKILSNDFSRETVEDSQDRVHFYEAVSAKIDDAAVFIDNELVVRCVNKKFEDVFGDDKMGTSLFDLFTPPAGKEASLRAFKMMLHDALMVTSSPSFEGEMTVMANYNGEDEIEERREENEDEVESEIEFENRRGAFNYKKKEKEVTSEVPREEEEEEEVEKVTERLFHFLLIAININGQIQKKPVLSDGISFFTMILRDLTKTAKLNAKLAEEKAKTTAILSNVLPQKVVSEIEKNNKTAIYAVNSASFVVVNLTNLRQLMVNISPSQFLASLKTLYESFDALQSTLAKFVRIPSFCENYVAAFGLFKNGEIGDDDDEEARFASFFALDVISLVKKFNRSHGVELSAQIGCCNGGPIVAGLVNLNAPTFCAFGWPIRLAVELSKCSPTLMLTMPKTMFDVAFDEEDDFLCVEESSIEFDGRLFDTYIVYEISEEEDEKEEEEGKEKEEN